MQRRATTVVWALLWLVGCGVHEEAAGGLDEALPAVEGCTGLLTANVSEIELAAAGGVQFVRPHPGPFAWQWTEPSPGELDWTATDAVVRAAQDSGVSVLGTLWPYADWDQASCRPASCQVPSTDVFYPFFEGQGIPASRCAPCDLDAWGAHVEALAERYDGDGVDDMPGLSRPVLHWEVLNEPELDSSSLTFFEGDAADYVGVLAATSAAIDAACPQCAVVQAGVAGTMSESEQFWAEAWSQGAGELYDIGNVHFVGQGDAETLNAGPFAGQLADSGLEHPIWVTEAELFDADSVLRGLEGALDAGAEMVFFTRIEFGEGTPSEVEAVYAEAAGMCR